MTTQSRPTRGAEADAGIRSAARALQALRAIGASPSGLTAAEIAAELGLGQATTYRLLSTLHDGDYIGRQPGEHRYILGRAVDELGRAVQSQLVVTPEVRAALRGVHDSAEAPTYLTVFRGDDIAVAHIEDSLRHPQITQLHVGFSEASHLTAFGKLMLASRDEAQLARYLERHGLRALTHDSVTDAASLREQLDEVRAQQIAVELEEYLPKLACIAAPVRNATGRLVGAVSVSVQAKDFNARAYQLERAVRRGAWQVSAVIG
ncbi:IclR family transcriptional regulator [Humibacter ginsenosidimutans]|uniref:Helix-turn-helix domain-containing protein n=1 Tax=Humibacter ginsenosidimutans TaxID=2599293 RepID=A0A5B8M5Z7_9MICO|nr:IclR family transcriptional regulator C-terminal domain-containing protein [Humibacter ginsenosidimutans]QDZ14900.1 helix-turn-helix domain-containing protein [Humibacter ginsenosidimutans]